MAKSEVLLTGKQTVDCDFRPNVPSDSLVLLKGIGVTDLAVIENYRVKSELDKAEVVRVALVAAGRIKSIKEGYRAEKAKADGAHATICAHEREDLAGWNKIHLIAARELQRWDDEQKRLRRIEEARIATQQREAAEAARREADRLQQVADAEAKRLREAGEMRAAKDVVAEADAEAQTIVAQAEAIAEIGVVLPAAPKISGFGESNKWKAREIISEDDPDWGIMQTIKAIASGKIKLRYRTPVRGGEPEMKRLIDFIDPVLSEIGNRLRQENIGIEGCEGYTQYSSRFSSKDAPVQQFQTGATEQDGW